MMSRDHENCWHCENKIYTLVFWSEKFGWGDDNIDPVLEENLLNQIERQNNNFEGMRITEP